MHSAGLFRVGVDVDRDDFIEVGDFHFGHSGIHRSGGWQASAKLIILYNEFGKLGCNPDRGYNMPFGGRMFALTIAGKNNADRGGNRWRRRRPLRPTSGKTPICGKSGTTSFPASRARPFPTP